MLAFSIPIIDDKIVDARHVLLMHEPGTESAPFVQQALRACVQQKRTAVYVALDRPLARVKESLAQRGIPPKAQEKIHFVDGWSPRMGQSPQAKHTLDDLSDLVAFAKLMGKLANEYPESVLILDSLSTILNEVGPAQVDSARETLFAALAGFEHVVAVFTDWEYEEDTSWLMEGFPGYIRLNGVKERVVTDYYFSVHGPAGDAGPVPYRRTPDGTVQGYIPKIVVVGALGAGKSSFVRTLSETTVGTERGQTTVAGELGNVKHRGLSLDLFGTPGHERFDALLEVIAKQATGIVLVVDASAPESFSRADWILRKVWKQNLPVVVAANKQDVPGALPAESLAEQLSLPERYPVIGCSMNDKASVTAVLDTLIDRIFSRGERS